MKKFLVSVLITGLLITNQVSAFTYKFLRTDADSQPPVVQPYLVADPIPLDHGGTGVTTLAALKTLLGIDNIPSLPITQSDVTGLVSALIGKEPSITAGTISQYWRGDKTWQTLDKIVVGLGNVDNTSDSNKPISTATQTALNGKALLVHTHTTSDIISGTFADARIGQSNVTQHQAALSIAATQVTGTKTSSFISDFVEAAQDAVGATLSSEFVYNDAANTITLRSRSFSTASRSLNTGFQVSASRDALVSYSVDISTSVSLVGGQVGTVYLEYADDAAFTVNLMEVGRFVNGNTGTLVVGLTLNQTNTAPVNGLIPANKYVRLRTQNNTGTPTFTYRSGQEVLL